MDQMSLLSYGDPSPAAERISRIPGLKYIPDFITLAEEVWLTNLLDSMPWGADLKRRVQHYGYRYDYRTRDISETDYLGPLPDFAVTLGQRLVDANLFSKVPGQVIVNEYLPGQGIAPHIDRETCFGETVASLSLSSPVVMDFKRETETIAIPLARRSLVTLSGPARHSWKHGIAARRSDEIDGLPRERERRLSLTFRTLITEPLAAVPDFSQR